MIFETWKDDYGLVYEPNYCKGTEADCRAAFQAGAASRDAEIAELVAALEQCNRYAKATLPTGYLALFTGQALAKVRKP